MKPELWAEIRRLALVEKLSQREISRRLRMDRKTIRRALRSESGVPQRAPISIKSNKLDSYKVHIQSRLKDFPNITAMRLLKEIKDIGYSGRITLLRNYVATLRPRTPEAFLRIETQPGEEAQVDWANCGVIRIGTAARKLSAFVMVLSYSRLIYVEFTLSQCLEDFLAAHLRAFQFFGGITKKCLYDNLKSVCLSRLGSEIRFNPTFMEFAGACLFEPKLCRPAHGNEKGKVESGIKFFRSSFFDGRPLTTWAGLQLELTDWLKNVANVRVHGTTRQRPVDRFLNEKGFLQPLPLHQPEVRIIRALKATSQALVHFDGNAYSVPFQYASKVVTLKASLSEIQLFDITKLIATHPRCFERGVVVENLEHYEGLLAMKKAAHAAKLTDQFQSLGNPSEEAKKIVERYLQGLVGANLNLQHHLSKIMELTAQYGRTEVIQAIAHALEFNAFGAPYLANIILQQRAARGKQQPSPLMIPSKPQWTQEAVEEQDLSLYDDLFGGQHGPSDQANSGT